VAAVGSLGIPHAYSGAADHVTISVGLALKEAECVACKEELLKRADDALYHAKEGGRNRFEFLKKTKEE
jgi:PleD family two-component response regulator